MEIKLLNGDTTKINLKKYLLKNTYQKSKFQTKIGEKLKKEYPLDNIYQEVYIPIAKFYLDFFIPSRFLVIECQGKQHSEQVKFFHKTVVAFNEQKARDIRKREWCDINGFKLIEINYDD